MGLSKQQRALCASKNRIYTSENNLMKVHRRNIRRIIQVYNRSAQYFLVTGSLLLCMFSSESSKNCFPGAKGVTKTWHRIERNGPICYFHKIAEVCLIQRWTTVNMRIHRWSIFRLFPWCVIKEGETKGCQVFFY